MAGVSYILVPSAFGTIGLLWQGEAGEARIQRVLLPKEKETVEATLGREYPDAQPASCARLDGLAGALIRFLQGQEVELPLDALALDGCTPFRRRVLLADYGIPRGRVSTYGRLARYLGSPRAGRAVGGALADNPFPLFVPCHRVIRADGDLGGFGGGREMKRALLQMEGLRVTAAGKVVVDSFYY